MTSTVRTGIVGCGCISQRYIEASKTFGILDVVACTDLDMGLAKEKAKENDLVAMSFDDMMADKEVQLILNLTPPKAHADVSCTALKAGKHVHSEKPLAVTREDGKRIIQTAREAGKRVTCAPDTFLGAGHQTARKVIDDGGIGRPIAGAAMFMGHGPERWHRNPAFFYDLGGGPMFDLGPYYVTALIHLLGPVKRVTAFTGKGFDERIAGHEDRKGERIPVKIPTHVAGSAEFMNGALVTVVTSFDVWGHHHPPIEIYGTEGSLRVPDPNGFGGPVKRLAAGEKEWEDVPLSYDYAENMRSIGAADLAHALQNGHDARCDVAMAYHVLDVMHAFGDSAASGRHVEIKSTCKQPVPLPIGLPHGQL
jgi:predicted dehydrogenase